MKAKNSLIMQAIGMYVMYLPLFVLLITLNIPADGVRESLNRGLLIAFLALAALMIPICLFNFVVSLKSALKDGVDPSKPTMVVKLALIPWYALNFVIGFVFVSIFFNPFMFIAIPVIIALLVMSTYFLMLSTSAGDIAFYVKKYIKNKSELDAKTIFAVVLLFVFCLDVVGAIILKRRSEKVSAKAQIAAPAEEENVISPAEEKPTEE